MSTPFLLLLYLSNSPILTNQSYSAASVFAANTILRSAVGAVFPLFTKQMFNNLGVQWAGTLLGCLAFIMIPIPLAFMKFGPTLRKKSNFAPAEAQEKAGSVL